MALIVANSNYDTQPLLTPKADGQLIANALAVVGFNVRVIEDIKSRDEFISVLRDFENESTNADISLIYYAGHGISVNGKNYLLPTQQQFEVEADVEDFALSTEKILRAFDSNTSRANILILDACRNNPFEVNWNRTRGASAAGLSKISTPVGSLVAYSTSYGSTAVDGENKHSPYALSLSKYLQFPNISIERVFARTREDVWEATNKIQRPIEENQLIGSEIVLNVERTLSDLTMANYSAALDTASSTNRAQIYATMLEVNKGDTSKIDEISAEWYNREFGAESDYTGLVESLSENIYWYYGYGDDSIRVNFSQEDFRPITDVWDNIDRYNLPMALDRKLALHELAFIQMVDVLSLDTEDSPISQLYETFSDDISESLLWAWLYVWQQEILKQDSISVDDYFLLSITSSEGRTSDNLDPEQRYTGARYYGDIAEKSERVLLRHDNFEEHSVRKMQQLEVETKYNALWSLYNIREDYDTVDYVLGTYAQFYDYGQGAFAGLAFDNAKSIIESSGAWCDSASFSDNNEYFLEAWRWFLYYQKMSAEYGEAMFDSDMFFYLNQARNWAVLYDKPTNSLDSLCREYFEVFDLYITRVDSLEWWDIVEYDIKKGSTFTYSTEVFDWRNQWDEANSSLWWSIRAPNSKKDIELIYETKKKIARTEKQLFLDHLKVGNGQADSELRYAIKPQPPSLITAHSSRLNNGIEINDWLKFIQLDIIDNKDGLDLVKNINLEEKERRVNLFLLTIVEPWFNELLETDYEDIGQFTTTTDLPLYWSVIDELFHLVKDESNESYFAHLYLSILMAIQHITDYAVDPGYFNVILDWYHLHFDSLSKHDRLYAQRLLKQYQSSLDVDNPPYDYYIGRVEYQEGEVNIEGYVLANTIPKHERWISEILNIVD